MARLAKQVLFFDSEKKHSIRYDADPSDKSPAMLSVYLKKSSLTTPYPRRIEVVISVNDD